MQPASDDGELYTGSQLTNSIWADSDWELVFSLRLGCNVVYPTNPTKKNQNNLYLGEIWSVSSVEFMKIRMFSITFIHPKKTFQLICSNGMCYECDGKHLNDITSVTFQHPKKSLHLNGWKTPYAVAVTSIFVPMACVLQAQMTGVHFQNHTHLQPLTGNGWLMMMAVQ